MRACPKVFENSNNSCLRSAASLQFRFTEVCSKVNIESLLNPLRMSLNYNDLSTLELLEAREGWGLLAKTDKVTRKATSAGERFPNPSKGASAPTGDRLSKGEAELFLRTEN
jgi:hypothetical protein